LGEFLSIGRIFVFWANFCILGEFLPIGRIFAYWTMLGSFFNADVALIWGYFSTVKFTYYFWQKMDWPKFWAIFSQTHLVTLLAWVKGCLLLRSPMCLSVGIFEFQSLSIC
jgi:hypothetical protein